MPKPARKMTAGSYAGSTKPQVQGTGSNQSAADLRMMQASGANAGAALRKVAPVGGQSYEDFQRTRHSPQGQADKDAYEVANKLPRLTDADYQQRRFNEGAGQVKRMAQASPGRSVFSGAPLSAAFAGQRDRDVRLGNYADTGNKAVTTASQADRLAKLPTQSAYVAPGVASGITSKDPGDSTPMKKKMSMSPAIAKYPGGAKKISTTKQSYNEPGSRKPIGDTIAYDDNSRDSWNDDIARRQYGDEVDRGYARANNLALTGSTSQQEFDKKFPSEDAFNLRMAKQVQRRGPIADKNLYAGGTKRVATSPFSEVDDEGQEQYDGTVEAPAVEKTELDMASARKMRVMPRELSADRDAGPKKPADYQEAAALIRSTPALKAQYKAGIASGKAFSLSIGGKTFKYAATPQKAAAKSAPTEAGWHDAYDTDITAAKKAIPAPKKMAVAAKGQGTAMDTVTSPQMLGEDAENAAIRKSVRKMASRS